MSEDSKVDPYDVIPLFSCQQWNNKDKISMVLYCVFEKTLLLMNSWLAARLANQIYIYRFKVKIPLKDKRY